MGYIIPNPYEATAAKNSAGISDVYIVDKVYKFLGCSVVSVNMSLGFNGTSSSASITLVEDTENGDLFLEPVIPSLLAISFPRGGVGAPIFYESFGFDQEDFDGDNVPFYFCGVCTGWRATLRDVGGRTITVSLADPREILTGVQCLLNGFALSHEVGAGTPRFTGVSNIIDVFGYYDYGMESDKNEFGMRAGKILDALVACRVKLQDMFFDFTFVGDAFTLVPDFYRLNDEIIDIISLAQKICIDGGSDLIVIARKISSDTAVVEFRAIRRTNGDPLTMGELGTFIANRSTIVERADVGKEFRNEATSSVIIGGMQNANYTAWPTEYVSGMHINSDGTENYNRFPNDIKVRLFGGTTTTYVDTSGGEPITTETTTYNQDVGAIFPFWGFTQDGNEYPLVEPFLPLDHLVFDKSTTLFGNLKTKMPCCKISTKNYTVRTVPHSGVFLSYDGDSDDRPFAYIEDILYDQADKPSGYTRGLPLNTEVLRAALTADKTTFFSMYQIHYPEISRSLGFPGVKWHALSGMIDKNEIKDLKNYDVLPYFSTVASEEEAVARNAADAMNRVSKFSSAWVDISNKIRMSTQILERYHDLIFAYVKQYAQEYMGKLFIVCLPKSEIMQRIWAGLSVPTRTTKPEIEYRVDDRGFWNVVPEVFDGIDTSVSGTDEEIQIRKRFMAEDGRFYPMASMMRYPTGNINFNSNGANQAMIQDLKSSDYRPNNIAEGNYAGRVWITCNPKQLVRRPDLALVSLPDVVQFDPTDAKVPHMLEQSMFDDEDLATFNGIIKYFAYFLKRNNDFRYVMAKSADKNSRSFSAEATLVIKSWARKIMSTLSQPFKLNMSTERVMDLECMVIPLTSNWVSYGPWYNTYATANGSTKIEVDQSLVPWNFFTANDVVGSGLPATNGQEALYYLEQAGLERLARTVCVTDYVDSACIVCAGFPEYGPAASLGYNSNITTISVDFGVGGIKTTYNFATYNDRPGTYRKSDYDNVSNSRIDLRPQLPDTTNINIIHDIASAAYGTNKFTE